MIGFLKRLLKRQITEELRESVAEMADSPNQTSSTANPYVDDEPWQKGELERLGRRGFAFRIAQTIGHRRDPAGLVLALYGAWGEGKTSILRMVEEDLEAYEQIVIVNFNPWRFRDPDHLIEVFFDTLADRLGNAIQIRTRRDAVGESFRRYGRLLRAVPYAGEAMEGIGEHLGEPALEDLRFRLEEGIRESHIRPVVVIDDMDRLERAEDIRAVIRLVKLTAGFRNTTYVLAFDPSVVAGALSLAGVGDGRKYLEKIVQVPLQLPKTDQHTLFDLMLEYLNDAIRDVDAVFPEPDQQAFIRYVHPLFLAQPRTIREAKRFANSVGFVLPLVAHEVNVSDMLLLEAIRTWYPEVHERLVEHREILVGDELGRPPLSEHFERDRESVRKEWERIVSGLDNRAEKAVREALEHLFPFVQAITKNTAWGHEWTSQWEKGQRAGARNYFDRYFQYAVPRTDVGDQTMDTIGAALESGTLDVVTKLLRAEAGRGATRRLIEKVSARVAALDSRSAELLARAFAATGDLYSANGGFLGGWVSDEASAARVIRWCLKRLPAETRLSLALKLVQDAPSLRFTTAIYQWLRALGSEREDQTAPLSEHEENQIKTAVGARLDGEHQRVPLYRWENAAERRKLLEWWGITCGEEHTRVDLGRRINNDPPQAVELLLPFRSHGWGLDTGLPSPDVLSDHDYESVAGLVDPQLLFAVLQQLYGESIGLYDEYDPPAMTNEEEAVAQQFALQHRRSAEEAAQKERVSEAADHDGSFQTIESTN